MDYLLRAGLKPCAAGFTLSTTTVSKHSRSAKDAGESRLFFPVPGAKAKRKIRLILTHEREQPRGPVDIEQIGSLIEPLTGTLSESGIRGILKRLGITKQQSRPYIHSPDKQYQDKLDYLCRMIRHAQQEGVELLFQDEFTISNQHTAAPSYAPKGQQPKDRWPRCEKTIRVAGALNAFSGQVSTHLCATLSVKELRKSFQKVCADYPQAHTIYLVVDNWPVHFHPELQSCLTTQTQPFGVKLPPSWSKIKPSGKHTNWQLPIQMISLPTYASWLNPIEKLWKLLKKELTNQLAKPDDIDLLKSQAERFFAQFEQGSQRLLRFCGLTGKDNQFYEDLLAANAPFLKPVVN